MQQQGIFSWEEWGFHLEDRIRYYACGLSEEYKYTMRSAPGTNAGNRDISGIPPPSSLSPLPPSSQLSRKRALNQNHHADEDQKPQDCPKHMRTAPPPCLPVRISETTPVQEGLRPSSLQMHGDEPAQLPWLTLQCACTFWLNLL